MEALSHLIHPAAILVTVESAGDDRCDEQLPQGLCSMFMHIYIGHIQMWGQPYRAKRGLHL